MVRMNGVVCPIITPFSEDDCIDVAVLERLIDFLIKEGISSVYPNGTTGEMLKLSTEERMLVAEICVKVSSGRIPVFVQVGAPTLKETIRLAEHALKIGADGVGVVTPQFFGVNKKEMVNFYVNISKILPADYPVYLYNIPQCAGNDLTTDEIEEILSQTSNVVGIKYSYPDLLRFYQYLSCGKGNFDVIVGPDKLFLPGLSIGCAGVVSGCSQCDPFPFVQIYKRFVEGDMSGALKAQRQAIELADIVKAGANMGYFKAALEYNHVGFSHMRAPAVDLSKEEKLALFEQLDAYHAKWGN